MSKAIDKAAGAEREVVGHRESSGYPDGGVAHYRNRAPSTGSQVNTGGMPEVTAPATPDAERWDGYGTALKPAWEPVLLVRKPLTGTVAANAVQHGAGALNIDGTRIPTGDRFGGGAKGASGFVDGYERGAGWIPGAGGGRWPANVLLDEAAAEQLDEQAGDLPVGHWPTARGRNSFGFGHAGQGELDERHAATGGASRFFYVAKAGREEREAGLAGMPLRAFAQSNGGQAAVDRDEDYQTADDASNGLNRVKHRANHHPTVKPLDLNRYLAQLLLPPPRPAGPARTILVPFAGSGSEMIGALTAGWDHAVGIEKEAEYVTLAEARLKHHTAQGTLFGGML